MRVFKSKWFVRFARKENISDAALAEAISRLNDGLVDADLGGGMVKQRVSRPGEGRSGGYRTIIALKTGETAFFIYGFSKNARDNIDVQDFKLLKTVAFKFLKSTDLEIETLRRDQEIMEMTYHG